MGRVHAVSGLLVDGALGSAVMWLCSCGLADWGLGGDMVGLFVPSSTPCMLVDAQAGVEYSRLGTDDVTFLAVVTRGAADAGRCGGGRCRTDDGVVGVIRLTAAAAMGLAMM